jgi:Zn-dependent peptidase ImmA (M78 family)
MMVDMSKVSWLSKDGIAGEVQELLNQWAIFSGHEAKPPIPVEAIAEKYLEFTLEFDDLTEMLGISDVLGATWANEKRMVINHSLLEGVEGRITFTCGHEIGHLILHRKYLFEQNMRFHRLGEGDEATVVCRVSASKLRGEWQADYFSSCLLMPREEVENSYKRAFGVPPISIYNEKSCFGRNNPIVLDPALDTVKEIAQKVINQGNFINVSREAMCYRLHDLGLLINLTGKPLVTLPRPKKQSKTYKAYNPSLSTGG